MKVIENIDKITYNYLFQLDILEEYMKYWIEFRFNTYPQIKKKTIKTPFEIGCKKYMSEMGMIGCKIENIPSNIPDWEEEVDIRTKKFRIQNPAPFQESLNFCLVYNVTKWQYRNVVRNLINQIKYVTL